MPPERFWTWGRLLAAFASFLAVGVLAAALFIWSGLYPVGAARDHLGVTSWLFERIREQSVDTYSSAVEAPPLDDPDLARLGAAHFEGGCVPCHARPGEPINAIVSRMLPPPPDLAAALAERPEPEEVFWIVKNGIKYTGMPAWPEQVREDEVWALTAFLARLRSNGRGRMEEYPELAGIDRLRPGDSAPGQAAPGGQPLTQCRRCHDDAGLPTLSVLVPNLAGQSEPYLRRALREYRTGRRPSGIMQPVAGALSGPAIGLFASYYAGLRPSAPAAGDRPDAQEVARGRELARLGDPERDIPACLACHGNGRAPSFPSLAGQHADYLVSQLQLWQRGGRASTTHGRIMATVARRLTSGQMLDAAAYFSSERREPLRGAGLSTGGNR